MNQIPTGSIEIPDTFIDLIADWFCMGFADPYRNPRMEKSKGLYKLGAIVEHGAIVELGTYHGNGAVALASGANGSRIVYTIDDYNHHVDWMGNEPGEADKALMLHHLEESGLLIEWVNKTSAQAASTWNTPLGLVYWDTGDNTIHTDFEAWSQYLVSGGIFVMHDTDDFNFHSGQITRKALDAGWSVGPELRMLYTVVKP